MLMSDHCTNIKNNTTRIIFNNKALAQSFFYSQLSAYKKCIELLKTFGQLIQDLGEKQFSIHDNESRVREIINKSIVILYSNLLSTLTVSIRSKQLFNISLTSETEPGYIININIQNNDTNQKLSYKINSIRLQINEENDMNMIKWIQNDDNDLPEMISIIGKKEDSDLQSTISTYRETINLTIDKLKVYELSFINLMNNFNDVLSNTV